MFLTQEEVLKRWKKNESREHKEKREKIETLRKNIQKTREIIDDAKGRYVKKMVRARSIKAAMEENPFKDLEEYDYSERSIQDAYGWEAIDEKEYDRLMDLLEVYNNSKTKKGEEYKDDVTELLDQAFRVVMKPYSEEIAAFEQEEYEQAVAARKFAEKNNEEEWDYIHCNKQSAS